MASRSVLTPLLIALIALGSSVAFAQHLVVKPTTTLAAQTANNTSAANSFAGLGNGTPAPGNVSKLPISSSLYSRAATHIYTQFQPWFGQPSHINVGYSSDSATQVHNQVVDMISRGITGAIVDWYGPNAAVENSTTLLLKAEAATHSGFVFAIQEDSGALSTCANTSGCSVTQQLISDLTYVNSTYQSSRSYMTVNGRPVVFFFGVNQYVIDWTTVRSSIPGNPYFIFNAYNGLIFPEANGYFTWVEPDASNPNDEGLSVLSTFYSAIQGTGYLTYGASYIGFNESLAPWLVGTPRIMNQKCGQTWLDTLNQVSVSGYSHSNQLPYLQVATWNDYEEGTAIETGISNCITLAPTTTATALNWSITGNENGVNQYTVYISLDGENLMPLSNVPAGTHTLNLSSFHLTPGTSYQLFVQAVGAPSFQNVISSAIPYTAPTPQAPTAVLTLSANSGSTPLPVTASTAGSSSPDASIASSTLNFGDGTPTVAGPSATHTYIASGSFTVTATVTDTLGATASTTEPVSVSQGCTISSANRSITICSPTANSTVGTPVQVVAFATDSRTLSQMAIYVDGSRVFTQSSSAKEVNTPVTMSIGTHTLLVLGTDSAGNFTQKITIHVN
jgi:hypothetical protein